MQNWNDDLLVPIRHSIDKIFRSLRDESTTELATDVAQGAARVIQKLIQTLEGKLFQSTQHVRRN